MKWLKKLLGLGVYAFTEQELERMREINDYDRYMDGSRQYDDDPETFNEKRKRKRIDALRGMLTQEQKDFMNYTHWRSWNGGKR